MCKYCECLKSFDLKADIKVKTQYWEYDKDNNEMNQKDWWITAINELSINYCPKCGSKLK